MHEVLSSQRVAAGLTSEAGAETVFGKEACKPALENLSRKEKRKELKKLKRRRYRQQAAQLQKAAEDVRLDDPLEQARIQLLEQQEAEALIKGEAEHERQERLWLEREEQVRQGVDQRREEELARKQEEARKKLAEEEEPGDGWEHVEDGPAEIIWQGNEIIVKKSKKKVRKAVGGAFEANQDAELPLSNPLQPQITTFSAQQRLLPATAGHDSAVQNRNFGTEQDKTNCPFHIKTGVCRFGVSCSRAHVYPEKSCTLLVRNMYNGPGLAWEHEDGLEHTEEEVYEHFEMFYDDVHEEFQKFGELVNFKVCRNGSSHLRGNVYAHYRREEDAVSAYVALNGRYYASKQISCEFVGVTRWRVAICGEYMKANYKPCSRGTVCNFLHCFRNPRGEYSWADWDLPAPRSWQLEMNQLFGYQTIHGADSRDGGYYRRPETEDRRHQFRDKQQYHSRRYKSSDSSSDDERAEKSRAKRKPSPPHTHNWGMDTVQHGTSGHHCTSEYKGADEHRDRFGSSQHRSHRKASHWADEIGKPFNDCNSDSEESNSSHRLWKSWALKHRSSWACNDTVPSPKNRDLTRASTGFKDGKQPDCSLSRHEDIRLKRADGHLNTGSAAEGKGRTSGYSDSGSEAHKSKCVNYNSNYNKPFILGGRLRNGHRCDRQGPHVSIKRERQQASYFDDKKWHSHRHKQGRRTQSSSSGPISDENYSEAGDQKRIAASAAHNGANSDDSESSNISPPTGNTTSGLRQSSTTGKYSSSVKRFHRHQEKVSDRYRKPRVGHSVKGTHSISSWFEMSSKDSHDLNDRWGG